MKKLPLSLSAAIFLFLVALPKIQSSNLPSKQTSPTIHHYKFAHLQRKHQSPMLPPPLLPLSMSGGTDPRFGVDKRLVPGGPNPLHN
ncbi:hypothetical protein Acr_19g0006470 [Actinidia rufa]|uniref:Uncharacterized protein n=1 Tax=Actinidia rufa TaxID=165716 RepID=A0A7J0GA98_9ERIC|nr:hypothetical protein Acr_19g0006470 [Actinidia rufa]